MLIDLFKCSALILFTVALTILLFACNFLGASKKRVDLLRECSQLTSDLWPKEIE